MTENKKNNIIINREKISSEEVKLRQNFGKILNNHQRITKRPIHKQKKFYFTLFLIVLVSVLLYLSEKEDPKNIEETTPVETTK